MTKSSGLQVLDPPEKTVGQSGEQKHVHANRERSELSELTKTKMKMKQLNLYIKTFEETCKLHKKEYKTLIIEIQFPSLLLKDPKFIIE